VPGAASYGRQVDTRQARVRCAGGAAASATDLIGWSQRTLTIDAFSPHPRCRPPKSTVCSSTPLTVPPCCTTHCTSSCWAGSVAALAEQLVACLELDECCRLVHGNDHLRGKQLPCREMRTRCVDACIVDPAAQHSPSARMVARARQLCIIHASACHCA
jgi:hypothetical protein